MPSKINMKSSSLIDKGTSSIECYYSALGEKLCVVDKKREENGFGFGNTNQTYIWTEEKK